MMNLRASVFSSAQVAIQAALDIGAHLLAELSVDVPKAYKDIFLKLAEVGILPLDFVPRLVGMAKFRNVLVHLYLEVDLNKLYYHLQHDLGDLKLFARYVSEYLDFKPVIERHERAILERARKGELLHGYNPHRGALERYRQLRERLEGTATSDV